MAPRRKHRTAHGPPIFNRHPFRMECGCWKEVEQWFRKRSVIIHCERWWCMSLASSPAKATGDNVLRQSGGRLFCLYQVRQSFNGAHPHNSKLSLEQHSHISQYLLRCVNHIGRNYEEKAWKTLSVSLYELAFSSNSRTEFKITFILSKCPATSIAFKFK